ncbi:hypothetical protein BaRGS_00005552 [Batillaria attramentaria]|uniref:Transmembrane protein 9 n=1 Tax=Batillaria attramentaria TaxID=370345 RepID=A0ABD0LVA5_9CAEN
MLSNLVLFCFIVLVTIPSKSEQASFEDVRCKCVCPRVAGDNSTGPVFIKDVEPNNCKCENVVPAAESTMGLKICNMCECKYESRNTTTIKVVVIFIICVVSMLFIYMLFLLCLDPLIARRPAHYAEHTDEEAPLVSLTSSRYLLVELSIKMENILRYFISQRALPLCFLSSADTAFFSHRQEDMTVPRMSQMEPSERAAHLARQRSIINRVTDEQKRWKGTVQEQRRNIYDRHTMLN